MIGPDLRPALVVLERLEWWDGPDAHHLDANANILHWHEGACPVCWKHPCQGHEAGCEMVKALRAVRNSGLRPVGAMT